MIITLFSANADRWFRPYMKSIKDALVAMGHVVHHHLPLIRDIGGGDVLFLLSCTDIVPKEILARNRHNIVIHESPLPKYKGWSPIQWQILEGKNDIVFTLFEASEGVDDGPVYFTEILKLKGDELWPEIRRMQGEKTVEMVLKFVLNYHDMIAHPQFGEESFYRRRTREDDELDIDKTIHEQFNHFRIANNELHPLWFKHCGHEYTLKIEKVK